MNRIQEKRKGESIISEATRYKRPYSDTATHLSGSVAVPACTGADDSSRLEQPCVNDADLRSSTYAAACSADLTQPCFDAADLRDRRLVPATHDEADPFDLKQTLDCQLQESGSTNSLAQALQECDSTSSLFRLLQESESMNNLSQERSACDLKSHGRNSCSFLDQMRTDTPHLDQLRSQLKPTHTHADIDVVAFGLALQELHGVCSE